VPLKRGALTEGKRGRTGCVLSSLLTTGPRHRLLVSGSTWEVRGGHPEKSHLAHADWVHGVRSRQAVRSITVVRFRGTWEPHLYLPRG
jgi:hypothetical protein